jgi:protocatechuate 3,4-dioxygenase beta subunit
MASPSKSLAFALVLLVALVGGLVAWLATGGGERAEAVEVARPTSSAATSGDRDPDASLRTAELVDVEDYGEVESTVVWPVQVDLQLLQSARFPTMAGVQPIGSGRKARLAGSLTARDGSGIPCDVAFLHGTNAGRELSSDDGGRFGATDLYPGLQVVELRGRGTPPVRREVRLRRNQETQLHVAFGLRGGVTGTVYRQGEEPLAGVEVDLGGERTVTDEQGVFSFPSTLPGRDVPIVLRKEGYATHTELVGVAAGFTMPLGRLAFVMKEAATLDLVVETAVGGPGDTTVLLLPANDRAQRDFPWYTVNPVRIGPRGRVRIENLPPTQVLVHAFHPGAQFTPPVSSVTLNAGQTHLVELNMEPTARLSGTVTDEDGQPVAGARVALEAPDRMGAALAYFGKLPTFLESAAVPQIAVGRQETVTDERGKYVLSAHDRFAPTRYLQAWSPSGDTWACRLVGTGEELVDLELGPVEEGDATLAVDFQRRFQGLPFEVQVNGRPAHAGVLPPDRPLVLANLSEGLWRLEVRWNGKTFFTEERLELDGRVERALVPPEGAIDGQDEETRARAGKL